MSIDEQYHRLCSKNTDIVGHMSLLKKYASRCSSVLELGVRGFVSTWAFLAAKPKRLVSVDKVHPKEHGGNLDEIERLAKEAGIKFTFILANDLELKLNEMFEMVFIDTLHTYEQLYSELNLYSPLALRCIMLHDTHTFGEMGEVAGHRGLRPAINDFLQTKLGKQWKISLQFKHCNGMTILGRTRHGRKMIGLA